MRSAAATADVAGAMTLTGLRDGVKEAATIGALSVEASGGLDDAHYSATFVAPASLASIAEAWRALSLRAIEPNAYLAEPFAAAAITHLKDAAGFGAAAVWRNDMRGATLIAFLPLRVTRHRWGLPLRVAEVMSHNYGPLGTPLLDRDHGAAAVRHLLAWLREGPLRAKFLLLPFLPEAGPAARFIASALNERGLRRQSFHRHERALAVRSTGSSYFDQAIDRKKAKELGRQRRRLAESGTLDHRVATTPAAVAEAVEAFLALEQAGWKGRGRTASLQRPDRAAFVRAATSGMAAAGAARLYSLTLDDRAIAVGIAFLDGTRAWFWKIAYDEAYARFSPGVQLTLALTDDLLSLEGVASIDSTADPGHPMIDHLWRERLAIADWLVDLSPGASRLPVASLAERARRDSLALARRWVKRLLRRG